jgi:DNA primase
LQFVIDARLEGHDLTRPEGRSAALADAAAVLAPVRESLLGKDYMNYLAGRLQTDFATVQRSVPVPRRQPASGDPSPMTSAPAVPERTTTEVKAERELVRVAALAPSVRVRARELLDEGAVVDETARRVLGLVTSAGSAVAGDLFSAVASEDREAAELLSGWLVDGREVEQVEYAFREIAARVKEFALGRQILSMKAQLRALDVKRDHEAYDRLFGEIAEAQRQQQELRVHKADVIDEETEHSP